MVHHKFTFLRHVEYIPMNGPYEKKSEVTIFAKTKWNKFPGLGFFETYFSYEDNFNILKDWKVHFLSSTLGKFYSL